MGGMSRPCVHVRMLSRGELAGTLATCTRSQRQETHVLKIPPPSLDFSTFYLNVPFAALPDGSHPKCVVTCFTSHSVDT